jgi:hypothetical protein
LAKLLTASSATESTLNTCVPLLTFNKAHCLGVVTVMLYEIDSLKLSVNLQPELYMTVLWAVSDLLSPSKQLWPSWSGLMQAVFIGHHSYSDVCDVEKYC